MTTDDEIDRAIVLLSDAIRQQQQVASSTNEYH